jgi:hypothetical protein
LTGTGEHVIFRPAYHKHLLAIRLRWLLTALLKAIPRSGLFTTKRFPV